jgi:hypothetical protein
MPALGLAIDPRDPGKIVASTEKGVFASANARGAPLGTFVREARGMPFKGAPSEVIPDRLEMVAARRGRGT